MELGLPYDPWREHVALAWIAGTALLFILVAPLLARERDHLLFVAAALTVGTGAAAITWSHPDPELLAPLLLATCALGVPVAAAAGSAWTLERIGRPRSLALRSALAAVALVAAGAAWIAAMVWTLQKLGM